MILPEEDSLDYLHLREFMEKVEKESDQEARDRAYQDEMRRG
jgi:hypothetical protein